MTKNKIKKRILLTICISTMFLTSCLTTSGPFVPLSYSGEKLLYPAVYNGISKSISGAYFDTCDIYNNKFVIEGIQAMDGLNKRMFDLQITLVDGILNYDILNAKLFNEKSKSWEENNVFLFFSKNNFFSKINAGVEEVMLNDEMYNEAKNRSLSDIVFLYSTVDNMNDINLKSFVSEELSSRSYPLTGTVFNVENSNENIDGVEYAYKVVFTQNIDKLLDSSSRLSVVNRTIMYIYYTNDESVSKYNKDSDISLQGNIKDITNRQLNDFVFTVTSSDA